MKAVYVLIAVCLVAGLAAGCSCKKDKGRVAGDACCSTEKPKAQ